MRKGHEEVVFETRTLTLLDAAPLDVGGESKFIFMQLDTSLHKMDLDECEHMIGRENFK